MSFQNFGLLEEIVHGVQSMRYIDPTPIQEQSIPVILSGDDLIASAQTGTGKTAAFTLPILSQLKSHGECRFLILEPTRELAAQVDEAIRDYARFTNLRSALLHGGVGYGNQKKALSLGADIVVATPGRLLDHMSQGTLSLNKIQFLVLDEADRMLDMGFIPDVRKIIGNCPEQRQTLLFSATLPPVIQALASWALTDPKRIDITPKTTAAETVNHALYPVAMDQKFDLLKELLNRTHFESVLIFTRTKAGADRISSWLEAVGHTVAVMHADRNQSQRTQALTAFKKGECEVMVATDLAARGIDISGVTHVINYDVPENAEDYVHRIGRTGRAQNSGDAFTLMTGEDVDAVQSIETYIDRQIERRKVDGFSYRYTVLLDTDQNQVRTRSRRPVRKRR